MKQIDVSIIIPCYNYGEFVEEAIDSCLASSYENLEIIVINDGSTDIYTNDLLRKLNKPKTKVIHQQNLGLSAARNNGIKVSKGKYIMVLDADDTIDPTLIEKACTILDENSNVGFVHFWLKHFGDDEKTWTPPPFNFYRLLFKNHITYNSIFRRIAWEKAGGFNETMREGYEDWDFWISVANKGFKGHLIPEYLLNYRRHGHTMLHRSREIHDKLVTQIRNNHPHLYKEEYLDKLKAEWN